MKLLGDCRTGSHGRLGESRFEGQSPVREGTDSTQIGYSCEATRRLKNRFSRRDSLGRVALDGAGESQLGWLIPVREGTDSIDWLF